MQIRKNDSVMVISGKERGKTGKVLRVNPKEDAVIIERINVVKRHTKSRGPQQAGGIVEKEASIPASNIMIMCDKCNAPVRIGNKILTDGNKVRVCRRCGEAFASRLHVEDLIEVERQLGYRYEMDGSGTEHYQWVCPRCRRLMMALAQGRLWGDTPGATAVPAATPRV